MQPPQLRKLLKKRNDTVFESGPHRDHGGGGAKLARPTGTACHVSMMAEKFKETQNPKKKRKGGGGGMGTAISWHDQPVLLAKKRHE